MTVFNKISSYSERSIHKLKYHARRAYYAPQRPQLAPGMQAVSEQLNQEGVCVTSLTELTPDREDIFWQAVHRVLPQVPSGQTVAYLGQRYAASHSTCLNHKILVEEAPDLFLWGLQPSLLNLVEYHLGQPAAYLGSMLRRDIPDHGQVGNRLWHLDGEDHKVIKVIVYLNPVDESGGPFEYIPKRISPSYRDFQKRTILEDADMQKVLPRHQWQSCTGPKGSIVIADTTSVFHHGKLPQRDRLTMMYAYTTATPKSKDSCKKFFPYAESELLLQLAHRLSKQQLAAAVDWRRSE